MEGQNEQVQAFKSQTKHTSCVSTLTFFSIGSIYFKSCADLVACPGTALLRWQGQLSGDEDSLLLCFKSGVIRCTAKSVAYKKIICTSACLPCCVTGLYAFLYLALVFSVSASRSLSKKILHSVSYHVKFVVLRVAMNELNFPVCFIFSTTPAQHWLRHKHFILNVEDILCTCDSQNQIVCDLYC